MWWKKNDRTTDPDLDQWAAKFEKEEQGDPTLKMAVELRKLRLATLHTPDDFRAALRGNLLDQHVAWHSGGARKKDRFLDEVWASRWLWIIALTFIAVVGLGYRLRQTWMGSDDWLYTPGRPYTIFDELIIRFLSPFVNLYYGQIAMIKGIVLLLGGIFVAALCFRLYFGLRSRYGSGRVSTAYWRSVAAKTMWMSASVAILLIVLTLGLVSDPRHNHVGDMTLPESVRANLESRHILSPRIMRNPSQSASRLGLAAGGAMDVNNFRENIDNGYLPLPTDITYEGLFYDYYFESGEPQLCDQLFCPTYAQARARNPLSGEMEDFLAVGLTSGMVESDFERKQLNLVVVVDISGSMDESFNRYYYDTSGAQPLTEKGGDPAHDFAKAKLQVAGEAVIAMLDHLEPEDRLGIVLFSDDAVLAKSLRTVADSNMRTLPGHLRDLSTAGGTNMEAGYRMATELLDEQIGADQDETENRIILLTDAQPNIGLTGRAGLAAETADNSQRGIYTTIVGIGVDFNTDLIESISKTPGANYYSVHAPAEFVRRMDEGFDYMVTPLVFDLRLEFDSPDANIQQVYGSPETDAASGELMTVNTLFPSDSEGDEVKGGLVLLRLQRDSTSSDVVSDDITSEATLTATYRDRSGQAHRNQTTITLLPPDVRDHYDHSGIRKGVLLTRYAGLLKQWLGGMHAESTSGSTSGQGGARVLGEWERQSSPLVVPAAYQTSIGRFAAHFAQEMEIIGDESLQQELDLLEGLAR